ncbi:MAG: GGDEF domain-containing protein [Pirellulales bacterium]
MLGYVTFVALLNLGLGYALAVYLHGGEWPTLGPLKAKLAKTKPPAENASPAGAAEDKLDAAIPPTTAAAELAAPVEPADPIAKPGVAGAGLVTRDYVDQLLAELAAVSDATNPASVVLMELDPLDAAGDVAGDRVLTGIANTVRELLEESHTAARFADQRFFLLLPGDDESQATQRAENVRQRIEATEFVAGGQGMHATVTCALAQLSSDYSATQLMDSLEDALVRAKRLGGNRTYMFDGIAPAPVVPPELNLAPQKCAI